MALIKCPECGHDVSDQAITCPNCGYPLKSSNVTEFNQMQYCPYCGKQNDSTADFCAYCGKNLNLSIKDNSVAVIENEESIETYDIMQYKNKIDSFNNPVILQKAQIIQQQKQLEEQKRQFDAQAKCPKCGSVSLTSEKKGFGVGKAVVGAALFGGVGLLAGGIGANDTVVTCLNCGYKFKLK